ncbi:hypothetical protein GRI58_13485 [Porphyrobacter algicida]|uniref:Uncharacterized protein n=1 Tax=Qipengyuania algicida TaxID=1836209 RepID=A0A845ALQ5_9SPHN|nr:hypothetical protein [Qipengyuania algicida]MXP29821.1 hypothetical protein [Qipengyuania algicida]
MSFIRPVQIEPEWITKAQIYMLKRAPLEFAPQLRKNTLARVEDKIVGELRNRRLNVTSRGRTSDGLTPNEWLRVTLYAVVHPWLAFLQGEEICNRIPEKLIEPEKLMSNEAVMFHQLIGAVLADNPKVITPSERDRLAQPMWHAFRHYIPPSLLLGFNHQYPAHRKGSSTVSGYIESELIGWVKEQRLYARLRNCPLDKFRNEYSGVVDDYVDAEHEQLRKSNLEEMNKFPVLLEAIKQLI